ncbi:Alpha-D-phosphohexomutase alpha/beta/alpha domain I [Penicillium bovifimosum]|uniref:Alpha-D-phosphohexomutase alpha/beta/alpha domain I n=1 Tax=Penicillium bovifimosum TaxID=126998 RepID=A0A9W9GP19_9EURO|nr:Alpha-D-phosphohexomutase alpha/beta/alpha domain I [Penicillium bovifimosum]KAJ5124350.1 Alpha-D-phosphohexomutase alpha/beta/alpha domain I [Penicillium bovifimosum]
MAESISSLTEQWLKWDQDPTTRAEIEHLRDSNAEELEKRLKNRIEFGTAGLRGRMAAGFSCMNSLIVIQASQGLAKFIRDKRSAIAANGVVIGHDARHNSAKFATLAANAFIAQRIPVWFFNQEGPTPMVAFGVNYFGAAAGIMVTASHNPPQDNGYKVYSSLGAQINRPEDGEIAQSIQENLEPWPTAWAELQPSEYLHADAYQKLLPHYSRQVADFMKSTVADWQPPRPFVYTPLHGVGGLVLPTLCRSLGINDFAIVAAQEKPDPDFPTVSFPNPEEVGALDLAIETANQEGKTLIIANDPDADRFAVAEKVDGNWHTLTGNHVGVLLASHILDGFDAGRDWSHVAVLTTTVSSGMLGKMAAAKGIHFVETLTGFKWMANVARDLENKGKTVWFAYEEALGYMFPSVCYDKDGITAAAVFLAAEAKWRAQGLTAYAKLQQLFREFGHHETLNNYFRSPDPQLTTKLFQGIRGSSALADMQFGRFKILRWRDLTEGYDSSTPDNKPDLPEDPTSQMLTLWLEGGVRFTFRGSGTEPKVKFYIESCGDSRDDAVKAVCDAFLTIRAEWVQQFTPSMTYSKQLPTSSGYILDVE